MKPTPNLLKIIKSTSSDWNIPRHVVYHIDNPKPLDPVRLLAAFSMNESSGGRYKVPRFEPAYGPGGRYFNENMRRLYRKWGAWVCCSYSSWQIMFISAVELGYNGNPVELFLKDEVAVKFVKKWFEIRAFNKSINRITLAQLADAYNSGSFNDTNVPEKYITDLIIAYDSVDLSSDEESGDKSDEPPSSIPSDNEGVDGGFDFTLFTP